MQTFESLYERLMKAGVNQNLDAEIAKLNTDGTCDPRQLGCLLKPRMHAPVVRLGPCSCSAGKQAKCAEACFFRAITHDADGNAVISGENCIGCGDCVKSCTENNLAEIREAVPLFNAINEGKRPVYAMIAPAYISQFSAEVTPGRLRSAFFKRLGFAGMIEVALFADILTLKEALEFDKAIQSDRDFMLTSCCCPMWIAMIKKVYRTLVPHLPPSVSPMVACGKAIKTLYKDAVTVFVGPCIAKKAEAREADIADVVDYVLTFAEIRDILDAAAIDPRRAGGGRPGSFVQSGHPVRRNLRRQRRREEHAGPAASDRHIPLRAEHADGARACKDMLKRILDGAVRANFIEGMGCVGGCVGGPRR